MIEAVTIMSVANMAKAVVKSSHEMGTLVFRLVNSRMWMRSVIKQQKHQQNMHQDQWDRAKFVKPADATNAKQVHVRTNSDIRTMPTGEISALISKRTIVNPAEIPAVFMQRFRSLQTALHSFECLY